jgi:hypothetical protein
LEDAAPALPAVAPEAFPPWLAWTVTDPPVTATADAAAMVQLRTVPAVTPASAGSSPYPPLPALAPLWLFVAPLALAPGGPHTCTRGGPAMFEGAVQVDEVFHVVLGTA